MSFFHVPVELRSYVWVVDHGSNKRKAALVVGKARGEERIRGDPVSIKFNATLFKAVLGRGQQLAT